MTSAPAPTQDRTITLGQRVLFHSRGVGRQPETGRLAYVNGFSDMPGRVALTILANWELDQGELAAAFAVAEVPVVFHGEAVDPDWHHWCIAGALAPSVRIPSPLDETRGLPLAEPRATEPVRQRPKPHPMTKLEAISGPGPGEREPVEEARHAPGHPKRGQRAPAPARR